jgi:hypothetical protein
MKVIQNLFFSFADSKKKAIFLLNTNFSLPALERMRYRMWLFFILELDKEELIDKILDYFDRYPELIYAKDEQNEDLIIYRTSSTTQEILRKRMGLVYGKYRIIDLHQPIYASSTSAVFKAIDVVSKGTLFSL